MKNRLVFGCFLIFAFTTAADAGDCIKDQYGNVVCGKGQCATDRYGKVFCAKEGGGAVRRSALRPRPKPSNSPSRPHQTPHPKKNATFGRASEGHPLP